MFALLTFCDIVFYFCDIRVQWETGRLVRDLYIYIYLFINFFKKGINMHNQICLDDQTSCYCQTCSRQNKKREYSKIKGALCKSP